MSPWSSKRLIEFSLLALVTALLPFMHMAFSQLFDRVMPMNDVLLYGWWLQQMQLGEPVFGVTQTFVYPFPSLVPMFLAKLLGGSAGILVGWCILISFLNFAAVGVLTRWGAGSRESINAAWFWVAYLALLGPAGIARIDAIAVSLAVIGVVCFSKGKVLEALAFFTFGAWIKIWPFALAVAAFVADRSKKLMVYGAAVVTSAILLSAIFMGANFSVFSFITTQGTRGIQIESPIATLWLWAAKLGIANAGIYYDKDIITNQVSGDWVTLVAALMTPAMFIALAITCWLGYKAFKVGADRNQLFAAIATTAVLDLIVFNKVGSPQFMAWLAVPVIAWLYFQISISRGALFGFLGIALLTNLVYPVFYLDLMALGDLSVSLLTIRNSLLIFLLIWANLQLGRLGKPIRNSVAL